MMPLQKCEIFNRLVIVLSLAVIVVCSVDVCINLFREDPIVGGSERDFGSLQSKDAQQAVAQVGRASRVDNMVTVKGKREPLFGPRVELARREIVYRGADRPTKARCDARPVDRLQDVDYIRDAKSWMEKDRVAKKCFHKIRFGNSESASCSLSGTVDDFAGLEFGKMAEACLERSAACGQNTGHGEIHYLMIENGFTEFDCAFAEFDEKNGLIDVRLMVRYYLRTVQHEKVMEEMANILLNGLTDVARHYMNNLATSELFSTYTEKLKMLIEEDEKAVNDVIDKYNVGRFWQIRLGAVTSGASWNTYTYNVDTKEYRTTIELWMTIRRGRLAIEGKLPLSMNDPLKVR